METKPVCIRAVYFSKDFANLSNKPLNPFSFFFSPLFLSFFLLEGMEDIFELSSVVSRPAVQFSSTQALWFMQLSGVAGDQRYESFVIHQAGDVGCLSSPLPDCGQWFALRKQLSSSNFCRLFLCFSGTENRPLVRRACGTTPFTEQGLDIQYCLSRHKTQLFGPQKKSLNYGLIEQPGQKCQPLSVNQSIQLRSLSYVSFH